MLSQTNKHAVYLARSGDGVTKRPDYSFEAEVYVGFWEGRVDASVAFRTDVVSCDGWEVLSASAKAARYADCS